ncbi:two component transcriptional regulator, LuxR family [Flavobacteriaceae bacterium MAR_2010_188]|nr:two component transcriptional regulator, LuxR family [Flavobacteriaceae bacterium MAR_2010_188]
MIKIAIIEDNESLRLNLIKLFESTTDIKCVLQLVNLFNVISELRFNPPDIILMDIGLPNINGIEGVRTVKSHYPKIEILMFTVFEDDDKIFEAIKYGASGYLLKKTPPMEIISAIRDLYNGGAPMSPSIARKVVTAFQTRPQSSKETYKLTTREYEVLHSLVDGLSYKKIAEKYCISISTIRSHICNIYEKLHVHSRAEAVAKLLRK